MSGFNFPLGNWGPHGDFFCLGELWMGEENWMRATLDTLSTHFPEYNIIPRGIFIGHQLARAHMPTSGLHQAVSREPRFNIIHIIHIFPCR